MGEPLFQVQGTDPDTNSRNATFSNLTFTLAILPETTEGNRTAVLSNSDRLLTVYDAPQEHIMAGETSGVFNATSATNTSCGNRTAPAPSQPDPPRQGNGENIAECVNVSNISLPGLVLAQFAVGAVSGQVSLVKRSFSLQTFLFGVRV